MLYAPQEGIGSALFAERGGGAVAGKDRGLVRELQQRLADRAHLLIERTAPQIRPADASLEKRVAAEEPRVVARQVKRHATGRVAGGVQDFELDRARAQLIARLQELVHFHRFRRPNSEPGGLLREALVERE